MALNVGINGFGRIGRIIFRTCFQNSGLKVSAINDPAVDIDYICYLIKFDSTHGKFRGNVNRSENEVTIDGHKIVIFREKLPANIPWQIADVQYVVEASGMFTTLEKASGHLTSEGVKRVLVTAPSLDMPMVVLGVNDDQLNTGHKVISCASSTLYCLAPIIKILEDQFGVSEGFITSIHAMTPSLKPLDGLCLKGKHWRDHRSIHQNIIPATTGACRALGRIIPQVKDKMTGLAFRVPIVNVSVLDITIRLKSNTTMDAIIKQVENAGNYNMENIIKISKEQAVSSDFVGDTFSCILDVDSSLQLKPDFFKLICWYENEYSYACRIKDSIFFLERQYQLEWNSKMSYIRPTSKQSLLQTKDSLHKFTYHQACSYECNNNNSRSLCSTSQDSGFKSPRRPSVTKKSLPLRNFGARKLSHLNKDSKKNNELFVVWNDEDGKLKEPLRHNRSAFFHSCVALAPQLHNNATKTRERLENVKREFSKMVIMTENLLNKSQHSGIKIGSPEIAPKGTGDTNIEKIPCCDETKFSSDNSQQNTNVKPTHINSEEVRQDSIFSLVKSHFTAAIKAKDNKSKEVKHENYNCILNNDDTKSNENKIVIDKDNSITDVHSNEIFNNLINNEKNHSQKELQNNHYNLGSILPYTVTNVDQKYRSSNDNDAISDISNSLSLNNYKVSEKLITTSNNAMQEDILNCTSKEQNKCKNLTENISKIKEVIRQDNVLIKKHKNVEKKSLQQEQNISCAESRKTEIINIGLEIANDKNVEGIDNNKSEVENTKISDKHGINLQLRLEDVLKKLSIDMNVSEKPSTCLSSINTITTASNRDFKPKPDIYDKLDSVSATDSENSFHMKERKSQVINITDLTNSLEDLERLDKICRIMEISDELSDQLLSSLNSDDCKELNNKKWSFKDFCERIKLDDFCNKIFNNSSS